MTTVKPIVRIRDRWVGENQPVYVIAEIGINHNGSVDVAKSMILGAKKAGCDAVKFQKRTPELCTPRDQWNVVRDTPWGRMKYIDYRYKVEFQKADYEVIDRYCRELEIHWFASCWDEPSVDFMEAFDPPAYKAASASLTDLALLRKMRATQKPLILSTGMSTQEQIDVAVSAVGRAQLLIAHATSAYPCPLSALNLRMIATLRDLYPDVPIGYSGHETGLAPTLAAAALGASFVERHVTLDRAMWGSDQAASVEMGGLSRLVDNIHDIEASLGDGVKHVYDVEIPQMQKLRRVSEVVSHAS